MLLQASKVYPLKVKMTKNSGVRLSSVEILKQFISDILPSGLPIIKYIYIHENSIRPISRSRAALLFHPKLPFPSAPYSYSTVCLPFHPVPGFNTSA